ncbi:MAG: dNTP triphosphohydrolase [Planctomycetes bacterium]|nr:dNTP triphosphohydrolase [Planctomycetota bacterium]
MASYAVRPQTGGGRVYDESADPLRGPFAVDRRRIINCTAFRRLEQKTQVFAPSHHDHFRTRLTHTLEVAEIARCLAASLRVNESLAEATALAHDLGHPPFGHAGEAALAEAMKDQGGFNHNTHAVRVVEYLEHPFPGFRGLNLTCETLAGLRAHETRYDRPAAEGSASSVETQIASVADRIAYDCHDLEDAIGAEFVGLNELGGLPLWRDASEGQSARSIHAVRRAVLDAMLDTILSDVIDASIQQLESIGSPQETLEAGRPLVGPSVTMESRLVELEQFLTQRVYQQPVIQEADADGRRMVLALFNAYRSDPGALPERYHRRIDDQGLDPVIRDYIAGMTDRFCRQEHMRCVAT